MDKTVVVAVESLKEHPLYRKKYKVTTKFSAHDETNSCQVGDIVEVTETRPRSRHKYWEVTSRVSAVAATPTVELAEEVKSVEKSA